MLAAASNWGESVDETLPQQMISGILVFTVGMFLWRRWRHDMVAATALLICVFAGLVPAGQAVRQPSSFSQAAGGRCCNCARFRVSLDCLRFTSAGSGLCLLQGVIGFVVLFEQRM